MTSPHEAGSSPDSSRHIILRTIMAILTVIVLALAIFLSMNRLNPPTSSAVEVTREPTSTAGANPFMPPAGTDEPSVTPPPKVGGPVAGNTPGLFGGTGERASCDPQRIVDFLQEHPEKAAAWTALLGIQPIDIPRYVVGLTSVVLRSDTYVTNHGFRDGEVTTVPAVLQAGTAVLVDKDGKPVVKCYCGNPLTPPAPYSKLSYRGPTWPGFSGTAITIIEGSDAITTFILVDVLTGEPVSRPVLKEPPTGVSPTEVAPTEEPPTAPTEPTTKPTDGPPADEPPTEEPPAEPAEEPPAEEPPAEPAEEPPAEEPPAEPAEEPPTGGPIGPSTGEGGEGDGENTGGP